MDELSNLWCCYDFCTVFYFNKERCWFLKAFYSFLPFVLSSKEIVLNSYNFE